MEYTVFSVFSNSGATAGAARASAQTTAMAWKIRKYCFPIGKTIQMLSAALAWAQLCLYSFACTSLHALAAENLQADESHNWEVWGEISKGEGPEHKKPVTDCIAHCCCMRVRHRADYFSFFEIWPVGGRREHAKFFTRREPLSQYSITAKIMVSIFTVP